MKTKILFYAILHLSILTAVTLISSNAESSTIKNGVNCIKAGETVKVGTKVYRCTKNPFVKPERNTWTLKGCLTAYARLKYAKEQYADWIDFAGKAGAEGQKIMDELQASITSLEDTMKTIACKRGA